MVLPNIEIVGIEKIHPRKLEIAKYPCPRCGKKLSELFVRSVMAFENTSRCGSCPKCGAKLTVKLTED